MNIKEAKKKQSSYMLSGNKYVTHVQLQGILEALSQPEDKQECEHEPQETLKIEVDNNLKADEWYIKNFSAPKKLSVEEMMDIISKLKLEQIIYRDKNDLLEGTINTGKNRLLIAQALHKAMED